MLELCWKIYGVHFSLEDIYNSNKEMYRLVSKDKGYFTIFAHLLGPYVRCSKIVHFTSSNPPLFQLHGCVESKGMMSL